MNIRRYALVIFSLGVLTFIGVMLMAAAALLTSFEPYVPFYKAAPVILGFSMCAMLIGIGVEVFSRANK